MRPKDIKVIYYSGLVLQRPSTSSIHGLLIDRAALSVVVLQLLCFFKHSPTCGQTLPCTQRTPATLKHRGSRQPDGRLLPCPVQHRRRTRDETYPDESCKYVDKVLFPAGYFFVVSRQQESHAVVAGGDGVVGCGATSTAGG